MKLITVGALACALILSACGPQAATATDNDGDAVKNGALEAQTSQRPTGAEIQERAENRVIRTVYICQNSDRLTVDFDNPRQMATVRTSAGEAVDLFRQQTDDGLWYKASGHDLRSRQGAAVWTAQGRDATNCRAVD